MILSACPRLSHDTCICSLHTDACTCSLLGDVIMTMFLSICACRLCFDHPCHLQTVFAHLQVFEKLSDIAVLASLPAEQQFICPYPSCSALTILDTGRDYKNVQRSCPHCQQPVCVHHKCTWHEGVTCDNYEGAPDDIAVLMLARQEGLARCPGCKIVTQRIAVR